MSDRPSVRHFRTLFLSDFHLGCRASRADLILDFLQHHDADTYYLVGDIVDGWRLKRHWYWPAQHDEVVRKLLRKARIGTRVVYLPGNHDEFLRGFIGSSFGGIMVEDRLVHETADGQRLLVVHGDEFDIVARRAPWLTPIGHGFAYATLKVKRLLDRLSIGLGLPYSTFSCWAKSKAKKAVNFVADFEAALIGEGRRMGVDGVVCGHIHHARIIDLPDIRYINTGDWMESCTAVAEHHDGTLEMLSWPVVRAPVEAAEPEGAEDWGVQPAE
jgi:UDP-2,3-diacylglucosamine pyrophosphatase LpxH